MLEKIKKITLDNILSFLFLGCVFTIPLKSSLNNAFLMLFIAFSIVGYRKEVFRLILKKWYLIVFLGFPFLWVLCYSVIYSIEVHHLIKTLPLFFLPIAFLAYLKNNFLPSKRAIIYSFSLGVMVILLYAIYKGGIIYFTEGVFFHKKDISKYLLLHRPYLGVYLVFAIFLLASLKKYNQISLVLRWSFISLTTIFLFIIIPRMAIISGLLILVVKLFYYVKKSNKKGWLSILVLVILAPTMFFSYNRLLKRESNILKKEPRVIIWKCSKNILETGNTWIYGLKGRMPIDAIFDCFETQKKLNTSWRWLYDNNFHYNAHNQYLEFWMKYGVLGLLMLVLPLFFFFRYAIVNSDWNYFYFLTVIGLFFMTESVLSRHSGMVFYSLFSNFYFFYHYRKNSLVL